MAGHLIAILSDDAEIEEAWALEVECHIAEIEAGRAPVVPAADAIVRAREAVKCLHPSVSGLSAN